MRPRALDLRKFLIGFGGLIGAPAIVRVASIMPVKALSDYWPCDLRPGAVNEVYGFSPLMSVTEYLRALEAHVAAGFLVPAEYLRERSTMMRRL